MVELERARFANPAVMSTLGFRRGDEFLCRTFAKPCSYFCFSFIDVLGGELGAESLRRRVLADLFLDLAELRWQHGKSFGEWDGGTLATHTSEREEILVVFVDLTLARVQVFFFCYRGDIGSVDTVVTWAWAWWEERVAGRFRFERHRRSKDRIEIVNGEWEVALGYQSWCATFAAGR